MARGDAGRQPATWKPWEITEASREKAQFCARVTDMRMKGATYIEIARKFGLTPVQAKKCAEVGASLSPADNPRMVRRVAEDQIMYGIRQAVQLIENPGPLVAANGKIVTDPKTGRALPDKTVTAVALSRFFDGNDRFRRLHGIDAPKQSMSLVAAMSAEEIRAMTEQVIRQAQETETEAETMAVIRGEIEGPDGDADGQ